MSVSRVEYQRLMSYINRLNKSTVDHFVQLTDDQLKKYTRLYRAEIEVVVIPLLNALMEKCADLDVLFSIIDPRNSNYTPDIPADFIWRFNSQQKKSLYNYLKANPLYVEGDAQYLLYQLQISALEIVISQSTIELSKRALMVKMARSERQLINTILTELENGKCQLSLEDVAKKSLIPRSRLYECYANTTRVPLIPVYKTKLYDFMCSKEVSPMWQSLPEQQLIQQLSEIKSVDLKKTVDRTIRDEAAKDEKIHESISKFRTNLMRKKLNNLTCLVEDAARGRELDIKHEQLYIQECQLITYPLLTRFVQLQGGIIKAAAALNIHASILTNVYDRKPGSHLDPIVKKKLFNALVNEMDAVSTRQKLGVATSDEILFELQMLALKKTCHHDTKMISLNAIHSGLIKRERCLVQVIFRILCNDHQSPRKIAVESGLEYQFTLDWCQGKNGLVISQQQKRLLCAYLRSNNVFKKWRTQGFRVRLVTDLSDRIDIDCTEEARNDFESMMNKLLIVDAPTAGESSSGSYEVEKRPAAKRQRDTQHNIIEIDDSGDEHQVDAPMPKRIKLTVPEQPQTDEVVSSTSLGLFGLFQSKQPVQAANYFNLTTRDIPDSTGYFSFNN